MAKQKLKAIKNFLKDNEGSVLVLGKHIKRYRGTERMPVSSEQLPEIADLFGHSKEDLELLEELKTFTTLKADIYGLSEPQPMTSTLYSKEESGNLFPRARRRAPTISASLDVLEKKMHKKYKGLPSCEPNTLDRVADWGLFYAITYDQKEKAFDFSLYVPRSADKRMAAEQKELLGRFSSGKLKDGLRTINKSNISDLTLELLVDGLNAPVKKNRRSNGSGRPYDQPTNGEENHSQAVSQGIFELYLLGANNDRTYGALIRGDKLPRRGKTSASYTATTPRA